MRPARKDVPKIRKIASRDSSIGVRAVDPVDSRLAEIVWHVWAEGGEPVGPVSADQIARGIRAGKVPAEASIRHEGEIFWSDLLDNAVIVAALKAVSLETDPPPPSSVMAPTLRVREFMVWGPEGCSSEPVGPVSADQIARGIRAGKVPTDASIRRVGELFATDVLDEPAVIAALKHATE